MATECQLLKDCENCPFCGSSDIYLCKEKKVFKTRLYIYCRLCGAQVSDEGSEVNEKILFRSTLWLSGELKSLWNFRRNSLDEDNK